MKNSIATTVLVLIIVLCALAFKYKIEYALLIIALLFVPEKPFLVPESLIQALKKL